MRKSLKPSDTACSFSVSCPAICDSPWTAAHQASLSVTNSWSLLTLLSIESSMPPNHLTLCPPLLLLPSVFPSSNIFPSESAVCIRWPKHWSFSFNSSPSDDYLVLPMISFRMDCLDLLAFQEAVKSQASILGAKISL